MNGMKLAKGLGALVILAVAVPAWGLGGGTADLPKMSDPTGGGRIYPGIGSDPPYNLFTYTGNRQDAIVADGYTLIDTMSSDFRDVGPSGNIASGTFRSEVYQSINDSLDWLFLYQVYNLDESGDSELLQEGNISGFLLGYHVFDSGEVVPENSTFTGGVDIAALGRYEIQDQVDFHIFSGIGTTGTALLAEGSTTSWFYVEVDNAPTYGIGWATIEDGAAAGSGPVFVPVPEPVTLFGVLLALGSVGGYVSRKRRAAR